MLEPPATRSDPPRSLGPAPGAEPLVGPTEAALRHPVAAVVPLVVVLALALALALLRQPVYTAHARVNVGQVDVPAYTLQGVVIGNQALAAGYARTVTAQPVVALAARAAGVGVEQARLRLDATPVPGSTLIDVRAEGTSRRQAIALANGGSESLIAYVTGLNAENPSRDVLRRFRSAEIHTQRALVRVQRLERASRPPATLSRARLELATARLKAQRLSSQYQQLGGRSDLGKPLQLVAPAAMAKSDFSSELQRLLLLGAAAGLVLGLGSALVAANRRLLRRPGV